MLDHQGTILIETPRLLLRPFVPEDADAMFRNWASNPEVTKYLTWPPHGSVEITQALLTHWIDCYQNKDFYQWAIVMKDAGPEPIGSISVVDQNDQVKKAEIGYCLGSPWWHQGITSEALKAVMGFLFHQVGMNRVEARHDPRNPNSGYVMKKCGMKYEGTLRQSDLNNQGLCDACLYALLADEFEPLAF